MLAHVLIFMNQCSELASLIYRMANWHSIYECMHTASLHYQLSRQGLSRKLDSLRRVWSLDYLCSLWDLKMGNPNKYAVTAQPYTVEPPITDPLRSRQPIYSGTVIHTNLKLKIRKNWTSKCVGRVQIPRQSLLYRVILYGGRWRCWKNLSIPF